MSSRPFTVDAAAETSARGSVHDAASVRRDFLRTATLFALNHGCTVSCLDLANARLGSVGVWQSGALYASYTLSALCGASYWVKRLGSRNGLIAGMGMSAGYVASFLLITSMAGEEGGSGSGWMRRCVAIVSAIVGGVGSSMLWVSQGSYFSSAARLFAYAGGQPVEDVTSRFGGNFASILLLIEVMLRLLSSFFIQTLGFSWETIFGAYSTLSIVPVCLMMGVADLERFNSYEPLPTDYGTDVMIAEEQYQSAAHKATVTWDLLRNDSKAKYLAPLNVLFGLTTSFCSSVLNGALINQALNDPNSTYLGIYTAINSMVASGASLLFGRLQSSRARSYCGKGVVITLGVLSYLMIAIQFVTFPDGRDWNALTLLIPYMLLGIGRATYEGTLRAIFADFFPEEKEGAFGNIILFSGSASTLGYILSATGVLQCDMVGRYCVEYKDGSIHNVLVMESVIIATAVVAIPAFWRANWIFRKDQSV